MAYKIRTSLHGTIAGYPLVLPQIPDHSLTPLEDNTLLAITCSFAIYALMLVVARAVLVLPSVTRHLTPVGGRYGALDGLRGVLAAGVFIYHAFTVHVYFTTGRWGWSTSPVFNHLGQTTVALFFMATGFLFALWARADRIDWAGFYAMRLARLFPLYATVVLAVFATVWLVSGRQLKEPTYLVLQELMQWLAFGFFGGPNVNGHPMTWTLMAGVNWSLKYEVIFYVIAIPLLHVGWRGLSARRVMWLSLAVLLAALMALAVKQSNEASIGLYSTHFLCGIVVAAIYADARGRLLLGSRWLHWMAGLAALGLLGFEQARGAVQVSLTLVVFAAVVGGASLVGLLRTRPAVWLGDISYSVYLIHGLVLWLTMHGLEGAGLLAELGLAGYGLVVLAAAGTVVLLGSASYICIEKPAMHWMRTRTSTTRSKSFCPR